MDRDCRKTEKTQTRCFATSSGETRETGIKTPPEARQAQPAKPPWIRVKIGGGELYERTGRRLSALGLPTVCEEALCPNRGHCWGRGRATVMILGERCTRHCRFCNVADTRTPPPPDPGEPKRVAAAVRESGLKEVVITSVTRDDLPDGGAELWAETIRRVHQHSPDVLVEVLIPDFCGREEALDAVFRTRPDVLGHNLETVPRLYPDVRPQADYARSLDVLRRASEAGLIVKTSLIPGLGETRAELRATLRDARRAGARIVYLGQYLQPTAGHRPVQRYLSPAEFEALGAEARAMGFDWVASAPLVRSSYHEEGQSALVRKIRAERK